MVQQAVSPAGAALKLADALRIVQAAPRAGEAPFQVFLACGFTPLHLETFLTAHLRRRLDGRRVETITGLYGDLPGSLARMAEGSAAAAVVVLEWPDLDPRLGLRQPGGWGPRSLEDVLDGVRRRIEALEAALRGAAARAPLALALPSLPLPPVGLGDGRSLSGFEAELRARVAGLAQSLAGVPGITLLRSEALDRISPLRDRHAVSSDLLHGFPYTVAHAEALGRLLAGLVGPRRPRKGLVTDLDETLWRGIAAEDGPGAVAWSLEAGAGVHGLYQQMLGSLAEQGVLLAVASKNDPATVQAALARSDLLLDRERVHPVEASWGPKSESITRILGAWNLGAESVVFVDDDPMELAEVRLAHPAVECLRFPSGDPQAAWELLARLQELFGRERVTPEDGLRARSLRQAPAAGAAAPGGSRETLLAEARARLSLSFAKDLEPRALELVNKTNQFNLNGRRYTEGEWQSLLRADDSFVLLAAYEDRYGPLGRIAVMAGRSSGPAASVEVWVMSCRAFSRRIEHRCLERVFRRLGVAELQLDFAETPRNGPFREFLASLLGEQPAPGVRLTRSAFEERCPPLHHQVSEVP